LGGQGPTDWHRTRRAASHCVPLSVDTGGRSRCRWRVGQQIHGDYSDYQGAHWVLSKRSRTPTTIKSLQSKPGQEDLQESIARFAAPAIGQFRQYNLIQIN
jgi:hypothetical protein